MSLEGLLLTYLILALIIPPLRGPFWRGEPKRRSYVRHFKGDPGPPPVIPEPRYICENCGMLIETGHGHTREECEVYDHDPTKPDLRLRRTLQERPGSNDPRVRLPRYHDPGKFKNWGPGR